MYRQYVLTSDGKRTVGWINRDPALRRGQILTLKDHDGWWTVEHAGTVALDTPPDVTWQVGGLVGRMTLPRAH